MSRFFAELGGWIRRTVWVGVGLAVLVGWTPSGLAEVDVGSTREALVEAYGDPEFSYRRGNEEVLTYHGLEVTIRNGRVTQLPYHMDQELEKRQGRRARKLGGQSANNVAGGRRVARRPVPATPAPTVQMNGTSMRHPTVIANGGKEVDLRTYIGKGRVTVVDFYADWCGPCRQVAPHLEKLVKSGSDVDVVKIDIVKWGSPVADQYGIRSIPYMRVFDPKGTPLGRPTSSIEQILAQVEKAR